MKTTAGSACRAISASGAPSTRTAPEKPAIFRRPPPAPTPIGPRPRLARPAPPQARGEPPALPPPAAVGRRPDPPPSLEGARGGEGAPRPARPVPGVARPGGDIDPGGGEPARRHAGVEHEIDEPVEGADDL